MNLEVLLIVSFVNVQSFKLNLYICKGLKEDTNNFFKYFFQFII
jgi:hypothetical protein